MIFQIVDRQTIARHLLSDQNDPFNRDPLTLDKVIPQDQLKQVTIMSKIICTWDTLKCPFIAQTLRETRIGGRGNLDAGFTKNLLADNLHC